MQWVPLKQESVAGWTQRAYKSEAGRAGDSKKCLLSGKLWNNICQVDVLLSPLRLFEKTVVPVAHPNLNPRQK